MWGSGRHRTWHPTRGLSLSPILSAPTVYALSVSDCVLRLLNLCRSNEVTPLEFGVSTSASSRRLTLIAASGHIQRATLSERRGKDK